MRATYRSPSTLSATNSTAHLQLRSSQVSATIHPGEKKEGERRSKKITYLLDPSALEKNKENQLHALPALRSTRLHLFGVLHPITFLIQI